MFLEQWQTGTVGGRWPDSTWLSAYFEGDRSISPFYVYYRKGDRWQRKANIVGLLQWHHAGFAPWTDGQTLALRVMTMDPRVGDRHINDEAGLSLAWERRVERELAAAEAQLDVIDPVAGGAAPPRIPAGVTARGFTARTTGEIDVLVEDAEGVPTLLHWSPGAAEPQRFVLPGKDDRPPTLYMALSVVTAPDGSLWVGADLEGSAYVARFDGRAWALRSPPADKPVSSLSVGPDGVVWAVTARDRAMFFDREQDASTLWRSEDGERWQAVALPTIAFADMAEVRWEFMAGDTQEYVAVYGDAVRAREVHTVQPYQVHAAGDDVWVVAMTDVAQDPESGRVLRDVVLRRGPVVAPLAMPSDRALRLELLDERPDRDVTPQRRCEGALSTVLFMRLPADAPTSGPVAQVEQLLASHPELVRGIEEVWEARHHGERVVAFLVRATDRADAAAMLAAMQEVVPEKRTLLCTQPIVVRPLRTSEEMTAAMLAYNAAHPPV